MKRLLTLLLLFSFAAQAGEDNILPYPIYQKKLSNGLNVVTVPFDSPGLAAFYIVVRVGSRDEVEPGKTGFAHFFEHMMFRGTEKYSKSQYSEILKSTGASANANTSLDRTVYHMTGSADKLEIMFDLESDRFQFLKYSVQDFKTEAGAVKGEYTKNSASPYAQLNEKVSETAFTMHTYGHTTMGYFKDIVDMPNQYEYSIEFFNRFYRPEYCTVIVVGDVTSEKVNAIAEKYFGVWKPGTFVSKINQEPVQKETRYVNLQKKGFPPLISLNYKGPAFSVSEMDMPALDILNTILFGQNSDLYKELVIEKQVARFIGGGASDSRDPNLIGIQASLVKAEDLQMVKDRITQEIEKAKTTLMSAAKIDETKQFLRNSLIMNIDNPTDIAETLSHYTWITGDPESLNMTYVNYSKVTAQDLMNVAKKYFVPEGLTIATISPSENCPVK